MGMNIEISCFNIFYNDNKEFDLKEVVEKFKSNSNCECFLESIYVYDENDTSYYVALCDENRYRLGTLIFKKNMLTIEYASYYIKRTRKGIRKIK